MDKKMDKGLMPARTFAEQYHDYVTKGEPSSDPYALAMHMTLVQGVLSGRKLDSKAVGKVYSKMNPDVKDSVKDALSDGQYSDEFVSALSDKYKNINVSHGNVDASDSEVLNRGVITGLDQTVEGARSGLNTFTPIQSVRELAMRNGATSEEAEALVASATYDLGSYAMSAERGAEPSDDAAFRFTDKDGNFVDYSVDAMSDKITMTGADGVVHDFVGGDADRVMKDAIRNKSMQAAIGQSFDFASVQKSLQAMQEQGAASFNNDEQFTAQGQSVPETSSVLRELPDIDYGEPDMDDDFSK